MSRVSSSFFPVSHACLWTCHRGANPAYTADELLHQIQVTAATLVIAHPVSLRTAVAAARQAGIPDTRVVVFDEVPGSAHICLEALVQEGLRMDQCFVERKLKPGEAKSKVAFLNFSSGTTGKPKVRVLYALPVHVANPRVSRRWRSHIMPPSSTSFKWPFTTRSIGTTVHGKTGDTALGM